MAKRFPSNPRRRRTFIKEWREYRNLTQDELAERLDLSKAQISRIENALQAYSQDFIEACAETLRTDVISLLSRRPEDPDPVRQIVDLAEALGKSGR